MVKLRNGTEEPGLVVAQTLIILTKLLQDKPIECFELVMNAKDPNYRMSEPQRFINLDFLDSDGVMHKHTRNILISSFQGEGFDIEYIGPVE